MKLVYVCEGRAFSSIGFSEKMEASTAEANDLIEKLLALGIVSIKSNDAKGHVASHYVGSPDSDEVYEFKFVGLAMSNDLLIVSYPKYFQSRKPSVEELRLILRAVRSTRGLAVVPQFEDGGERTGEMLHVMLSLLDLYAEYGEYSNYIQDKEVNGSGFIDWNRTINGHLPVLSRGRPVYIELETRKLSRNSSDYITRLHRAVLTECSRILLETGVSTLLGLGEVWLSDESVDDLGDINIFNRLLRQERGSQFVDWKLQVLSLLEQYLLRRQSEVHHDEIQALGTTSFYSIWEQACGVALGNLLHNRLDELGLNLTVEWLAHRADTLLSIIPRPKWERLSSEGYIVCQDVDTLIPDAISFAVDSQERRMFCIYDAKYYLPTRSGEMKNQPGLESVTKQFLYQSAYKKFLLDHGFDAALNAFLVPNSENELIELGRVSFREVMGVVDAPLSNYVVMWALPANKVLEAYVRGANISEELRAIWDSNENL